ncbi:hypothetical protein JL108_10075 [Aeromicrobium sp. YIM 150415]|uniref:hypothetical protein n=1 Tax=Aeromicrobium sp. YIM 150415 TaxID=2803912 RepID=UPI001962A524|nr:hypothetical protein [Aeromicrobium sp. YIM 150415]MBM9463794.1 hypothetical protein [Aeromicrobium sp. YIM 150415]
MSVGRRRILAFARRAWRQQRSTAVWLAAVVGGVLGVVVFLGSGGANTLPELSELIPTEGTGLVSVHDDGGFLPMTAYVLTMAPAVLGMLVAVVATLTLPGVVADDVSGGGIEVLLAGPIPRRSLFIAYLGAGLLLTAASWVVATVSFALAMAATAVVLGVSVTVSVAYVAAIVVVPLSMAIWSSTVTLFGALLYPGSLESKAGLNGGPIRLLAMLPALVAVPSVLLLPGWVLAALACVLVGTTAASAVLVALTARGFRSTRVLSA